jgi:beta-galactosidase
VVQASILGGAGVAALPLIALVGSMARSGEQEPVNLTYSMNTNWLFGGQYMAGSESSFYDDSDFARIVLPHTVTPLSWQNWDFEAWQQVWIYRRHFSGAHLLGPHRPGNRIFVDFDGVMVNATVVINDQAVSTHQGGYLPWSAELTGKVAESDNLLAVIVDSRCLPVPPIGVGRGPASVDFFQPGGIYRDVNLRVLPQVFLSDLFALPANVLSPQRRVDIECSIDAATAAQAAGTLTVELFDGTAQITSAKATVKVTSPGISTAKLSLTDLGPISLWSPDSPKLYQVQPRAHQADRVPRGIVPAQRFLPERRAAAALRPRPAPALPLRRHGDARPGPAQGRRDPQERVQLQHGALLALSPVAAFPRRLR